MEYTVKNGVPSGKITCEVWFIPKGKIKNLELDPVNLNQIAASKKYRIVASTEDVETSVHFRSGKFSVALCGVMQWDCDADGYCFPVFVASKGKWVAGSSYRTVRKNDTVYYSAEGILRYANI